MAAMPLNADGLEALTKPECQALLAASNIGRVAITLGALPVILPVNFALLDDDVIFLTGGGTKLSAALTHAIVAFEVDHINEADHTGWSVLVIGQARTIQNLEELQRARTLHLRPWAPDREHYVRVQCDRISGRRINP